MATRRRTRRLVIGLLVVSVALLLFGIVASGTYDAVRDKNVWTDAEGQRLPETTVHSFSGPEHCGWQDILFMDIGYDSGLTQPGLTGAHHFLRDEQDLLGDYTASKFQPRVTLPPDAVDTGWNRDGHELWLDPEGDAAFLEVDDAQFEMWPRASVPACV